LLIDGEEDTFDQQDMLVEDDEQLLDSFAAASP
jgi:hypothetical protein